MIETISSSPASHATSTDIPDLLSPPLPIVHRFRRVLRATSRILTELLYVDASWSPLLCWAMWRGPLEYITYELVPTSPAMSCMSGNEMHFLSSSGHVDTAVRMHYMDANETDGEKA